MEYALTHSCTPVHLLMNVTMHQRTRACMHIRASKHMFAHACQISLCACHITHNSTYILYIGKVLVRASKHALQMLAQSTLQIGDLHSVRTAAATRQQCILLQLHAFMRLSARAHLLAVYATSSARARSGNSWNSTKGTYHSFGRAQACLSKLRSGLLSPASIEDIAS